VRSGLLAAHLVKSFELDAKELKSFASELPDQIPNTRVILLSPDDFDEFFGVFHPPPVRPTTSNDIPCGALAVELDWPSDTILAWGEDSFTLKTHSVGSSESSRSQVITFATDDDSIYIVVIPIKQALEDVYTFASRALNDCEESEGPKAVRLKTLHCYTSSTYSLGEAFLCENAIVALNAGRKLGSLAPEVASTTTSIVDFSALDILDLTSHQYLLCIHHVSCDFPLHVVHVR